MMVRTDASDCMSKRTAASSTTAAGACTVVSNRSRMSGSGTKRSRRACSIAAHATGLPVSGLVPRQEPLREPRPVRRADRQVGVVEVVLRVVHHRAVLAVAEPQEAARLVLQVVSEILAAGGRAPRKDDALRTDEFLG